MLIFMRVINWQAQASEQLVLFILFYFVSSSLKTLKNIFFALSFMFSLNDLLSLSLMRIDSFLYWMVWTLTDLRLQFKIHLLSKSL